MKNLIKSKTFQLSIPRKIASLFTFTFRERWPLGRFLSQTLNIVHTWSDDRNPDYIHDTSFSFSPNFAIAQWKKAYAFLKVKNCFSVIS